MLKIGFIFPSSEYLHDPFRGDPHTHFQILTILEDYFGPKVELSLIDLRGIKKEFAFYHIPECDVYLHSVYTLDYNEQISIVKTLKDRYPLSRHIAGGPHAIEFQEDCLKIFDSLIIGDGEELIIQSVKDMICLKLKPIYKQESVVDINQYPYPRRKWLTESTISRKGPGRGLISLKNKQEYENLMSTTAIFSRGCPYKCHFCHMPNTKKYGLGIRFRKPELIKEEIEYLKKDYGIQAISFLDEICMPLNRDKTIAHLEAIGQTGILWKAQCRVDGITPEIAALAKGAGCVIMCMGMESVSQKSLDLINKKISVEQAKKSIRHLKNNGIEVRIYLILGLPGEPNDIVEQTWTFIKETEPDLVYLCLLTVRPGTEMYNHPEKFGFKAVNMNWDKTMHLHSRYEDEFPSLSFEYREQTPWGKSLSNDRIIKNYLELQETLKEAGLCTR
ncbi:MAG: B12-binding domain-containing radical SAM protein [Elusimicrobia bacterium]|nr:B12-binding domain-containing radical SAM protein [Elusimicrobiota bacterium]